MDNDLLTALYYAAQEARRALVAAVGDTAMECQGFVNGFRLAMGVCGYCY